VVATRGSATRFSRTTRTQTTGHPGRRSVTNDYVPCLQLLVITVQQLVIVDALAVCVMD